MKILFVLNQLPYPPRNGVTIPTFNYMQGLAGSHNVSLLFLREPSHDSTEEMLEQNRALVKNLWVTDVKMLPASQRIRNELRGEKFFHIGRSYDMDCIKDIFSEHRFDVIWISDERGLDLIEKLRELAGPEVIFLAGLNDCITDVFLHAKKQVFIKGGSLKEKLLNSIKWMRGLRAGPIETRVLRDYDFILVQSDEDSRSLSRVSAGKLASKVVVLSNGVASELLETEITTDNKNLLFVGSLRGYSRLVEWLLEDVWPAVKSRHPDAAFYIIGKGASELLQSKIAALKDVIYIEFVADIRDVYKDKALSFSPVFKNYGLINKVVESMAAGVPVIADRGSFNGIPEFEPGKHGMVGDDAAAMVDAADQLLNSSTRRAHMGRESRNLILNHFKWEDRIRTIENRFQKGG